MEFLSQKQVLVLGLGESGLACARFAAAHGAHVRVADTRADAAAPPPQLAQLKETVSSAQIVLGPFGDALLEGVDRIAISPGLAPDAPEVKPLLEEAARRGIAVDSEIEWFALALHELAAARGYTPNLVAITGTNGKTTVTKLAEHLAHSADIKAIACGNVSPAALDALAQALADDALPDLWILELSSFQLHFTRSLAANAATVLNLSQDHLDWHGSMQAYAADKARIFGEGTVRVLNRDDPLVAAMRSDAKLAPPVVTFGLHAPLAAGDWGVQDDGGLRWLAQARAVDDGPRKKGAPPADTQLHRLMPADALRIRGSHNHANALAALALLDAVGTPLGPMLRGLRDYAGEPHRAQFVANVDGVDYIDDSKGTNVGATLAAIQGFAEGRRRIVLIAGGQGKGQDFAPLVTVAPFLKAAVLIGADAGQIENALNGHVQTIARAADLPQAVAVAAQQAVQGDVALLSPACASLDMFKNYAHRAQVFVQAVHELAAEAGQA
ncbi:MAG: UDP-N-acetylmuramoyl-L-alanine--D-glutamate ligase [Burkholderiaceae bacterium]